jgi:hypothetical protein
MSGGFNNPDDYAVVVGINRYRAGFVPLQGSVNDAKLFVKWLTRPDGGGLDPKNIKCLTTPDDETFRPIRDEIEDELIQLYERRNRQSAPLGRRLYLFFSGHGVGEDDECALITANASRRRCEDCPDETRRGACCGILCFEKSF